jgi:phosphatidylcholine synthase
VYQIAAIEESHQPEGQAGMRIFSYVFNYKAAPYAEMRAFAVHLLTASGSFLAFLGVVAASERRFVDMFWWLGLALIVDGIDGPIARKVRVKEVLPNWSGDTLDNIIDYVTYVLLPAFALYESGMIGQPWSFVAAGLIVVSSAIYYADMGMKTEEYFFSGFPVVWNMVIFTLFVIDATATTALVVVVVSVILTFLPIHFLHPVRVKRLRPLNMAVFVVWAVLSGISLLMHFATPGWVVWGVVATGLYMYCIGAVLQLFPKLGRKD